jgi:hypothetical protein
LTQSFTQAAGRVYAAAAAAALLLLLLQHVGLLYVQGHPQHTAAASQQQQHCEEYRGRPCWTAFLCSHNHMQTPWQGCCVKGTASFCCMLA